MKLFDHNRKRIKVNDRHLIRNRIISLFVILFTLVIIPFHLQDILSFSWGTSTFNDFINKLQAPYFLVSVITALFLCSMVGLIYYRYRIDKVRQYQHRQKLARMILENGWYERTSTESKGFFKDFSISKEKEKITYFPKIYYHLNKGVIYIKVEITLGKYQDQLLRLERKLESGLYCELVSKELKDSYVEYTLLYDTIANRISINDVVATNGRLKLMETVYWDYDKLPHMLIAGGTGGGKTYFILTLIKALAQTNANIYVLDPKNADLADLEAVMPNVYFQKDDMLRCLNQFYNEMMERNQNMKQLAGYKTGENYAYLDLPANFLVFDEYTSFMEMIGRESVEVMSKLKQIVMLGRQSGFFLILACQRPDAKHLGDGIRDNFNFRVALGRMSELGYNMMFGENDKDFFLKQIKGRGYVDLSTSVISEFYTPLVPKGYDFLAEIGKIYQSKSDDLGPCDAQVLEADDSC